VSSRCRARPRASPSRARRWIRCSIWLPPASVVSSNCRGGRSSDDGAGAMKLDRLVLASGNAGKLAEMSELLAPLGVTVQSQAALGVTEAEEPHVTFIENALVKARRASRLTGLPAMADDSGLCVDA